MDDQGQDSLEEMSYIDQFTPGRFNPLSEEVTEFILKSIRGERSYSNQESCGDRERTELISKLQGSLTVLSLPPRFTTVRVNLQKISLEDAVMVIERHLNEQYPYKLKKMPKSLVYSHSVIPDLIAIESHGFRKIFPTSKEVIVGRLCGSAVLRGAEVFAPGILGATPDLRAGEEVAVFVDLDDKCLRGSKIYNGQKMFIGNGTALQGRRELFRQAKPVGVAVTMKEKVFDCPSIGDLRNDVFFLQNLPSVLCSHVLAPERNGIVLDMCAAPGGKATHLATLVGNAGHVIAIDRSQKKIDQIKQNAEKLGLTNICAFAYDSTKLVSEDFQSGCKKIKFTDISFKTDDFGDLKSMYPPPPYPPSSFKWILLDAPCSALGQRPQIQTKCTSKELNSFPVMQRKLLESAVKLLASGGMLVYSTCTIVANENEKMVKWVLDNFKSMQLMDSQPKIGYSGLTDCGLSYDQCKKVQRFGPGLVSNERHEVTPDEVDTDTIGFFIALFQKVV